MKFLFGDSTPFPLGFDFLATLGHFMTAATTVVMQSAETRKQQEKVAESAEVRLTGLKAVQALNDTIVDAIDSALTPPLSEELGVPSPTEAHPAALEHARRVKADLAALAEEQKRAHKGGSERETAQLRADQERRAAEMRSALDQFFRVARLPVLTSRITAKLGEGREPKYEVCVVFRYQGDVVTSFVLGTASQTAWNAPRKVTDFMPALDLTVGVKKSFFKGTVTPEAVHFADWIVSHADVHDAGAELALRRKVDQKDAYVFKIAKSEQGWRGLVERPEDPNAGLVPPDLELEDTEKVLELCRAVRDGIAGLVDQRESMLRLELDGRDVLANGLAMQLVVRLVKVFAPTVEAIVQRSTNSQELSLKKQHEDGRREELYLRREELLNKLQPLNADGRSVFEPLGLEDWVPPMTMRPPEVR